MKYRNSFFLSFFLSKRRRRSKGFVSTYIMIPWCLRSKSTLARTFAFVFVCVWSNQALVRGQSDAYDMYLLTRQWGPTFCDRESNDCVKSKEWSQFSIHGLWPSNTKTGSSPSFCDDSDKFSVSNLEQQTVDRLNCAWPSLTGSNEGFWSYEYSKHGTCASMDSQEEYFDTTLNLNDKYDVNVALQSAGIDTSATGVMPTVEEVQDAMESAYNVPVIMKCDDDNVYEIWMCFDKTSLKPFECPPDEYYSTCGKREDSVSFPQGTSEVPASCEAPTTTQSSNILSSSISPRAPSFLTHLFLASFSILLANIIL